MDRVSLKYLANEKQNAIEYLARREPQKKKYETLFQDISERVDKLRECVTGDDITLFLEKMIQKCVIREN